MPSVWTRVVAACLTALNGKELRDWRGGLHDRDWSGSDARLGQNAT